MITLSDFQCLSIIRIKPKKNALFSFVCAKTMNYNKKYPSLNYYKNVKYNIFKNKLSRSPKSKKLSILLICNYKGGFKWHHTQKNIKSTIFKFSFFPKMLLENEIE